MEPLHLVTSPTKLLQLAVVCIAGYTLVAFTATVFSTQARFLRRQEWASKHSGWLSGLRDGIESISGTKLMLQDAYTQHSKLHQPFVLPQFNSDPFVVLPPTKMKVLLQKSDDEVNLHLVLRDMIAAQYTGDLDIGADPFHLDIARQELTRKLPTLTAGVYSELVMGFEDQWRAKADGWTSVHLLATCVNIVSRGANRAFSGEVLCRNQEFLTHTREYAQTIFQGSGMLNMLPRFLRPTFGPLIKMQNKKHVRVCMQYAGPIIEERIAALRAGNKSTPNDALQWLIERCIAKNDPVELEINRITRRLMRLNMLAIHTTSITITNTILDIYTSPQAKEILSALRDEVSTVLASHGGQWTKAAVDDLHRADSAIKESMRINSFQLHGMVRLVTSPKGADFGEGVHVPQGVRVAMPIRSIHCDPEYYPNPDEYDAFRFSRTRETLGEDGKVLEKKAQSAATTSDTFLSWGHGKHACPGRFFASQELKLMLAIIAMNFDIKVEGGRPKNVEIKGGSFPDPKVKVEVRLRLG